MKRLCFGTVYRILYNYRGQKVNRESLLKAIAESFGVNLGAFDASLPGHLKSGKNNFAKADIDAFRKTTAQSSTAGVHSHLLKILRSDSLELIVKAIKMVLAEDTTISDDAIIGYGVGYEKRNIVSCTEFDFCELLACVIYYSIVNVSNTDCKDGIKEIDDAFFDSVPVSPYEVHFQTEKSEALVPLKKSLRGADFGRTFIKVCDGIIPSASNSSAQFYTVDINNCSLKFRILTEYLGNHIGEYVMSRSQISEYERQGLTASIGLRSAMALIQKSRINGAWKEETLGEILLYLFLEQELNAPKILSKFEVNAVSGSVDSKCDGVYLLSTEDSGVPFRQLVFGASDIVDNLTDAVNHAFDKIVAIQGNENNEYQMVEESVFHNIYDPETTRFMENIILPKPPEIGRPDMAFGVFLGYTLGLDSTGLSAPIFKRQALDKIRSDIEVIKPHIVSKIQELGLDGYSFYFYVLPFNDAPTEKTQIVNDAFLGGVV